MYRIRTAVIPYTNDGQNAVHLENLTPDLLR